MASRLDVLEMLANGESSKVEFKRDDIDARGLAKELVAFANHDGGTVLLGVSDDGSVVGVQRPNLKRHRAGDRRATRSRARADHTLRMSSALKAR